MESIVRPLSEAERRLVKAGLAVRRRRLRNLPKRSAITGLLMFGGLWSLTVLATMADKKGPSWYISGIVWFGIGLVISLWSYMSIKPKLAKDISRFEGALGKNEASVIRIRSEAMIEFEEMEDEGACYAFQLDDGRIVVVAGQEFYPSAKFPNTDFSLVDICGESGVLAVSLIEKHGRKIDPARRISAAEKMKLKIPDHLQTIDGQLSQLEYLLAS